jgi:hypothetical protein
MTEERYDADALEQTLARLRYVLKGPDGIVAAGSPEAIEAVVRLLFEENSCVRYSLKPLAERTEEPVIDKTCNNLFCPSNGRVTFCRKWAVRCESEPFGPT